MQGKSRVMAAVAAGALVVALGAGAARCAIAPQEGAQGGFQEQTPPGAADADAGTVGAASGAEALWCVPSSKNRQIRLSNFDTLMLTASGRAGAVAAGPPAA